MLGRLILAGAGVAAAVVTAFPLVDHLSSPAEPARWREQPATSRSIAALLAKTREIDEVWADGYDRSCAPGRACVFGPSWSDDHDADGGHNTCDTRNDILRRDLDQVRVLNGTSGCVVAAGVLRDPYTGQEIRFTRRRPLQVQIDHVYPLAAAWHRGASGWSPQRRRQFANDPANLIAVAGDVNEVKGAGTPGEWLPSNKSARCRYVAGFLRVAIAYNLPVEADDRGAAERVARRC